MNRQIDCFARLMSLQGSLDDVIDFLLEEKMMKPEEVPTYRKEVNKSQYVWNLFNEAKKAEKIMLFDFEWQLLPIERIKITIVTERSSKSFHHNHI